MAMLDESDVDVTMDLRRPRAGSVDRWVRVVVVAAIAATFAILFAGPRLAWARDSDTIGIPAFWFRNALALGFVGLLVIALVPATRASRYVRLAVMLPVVQIVLIIGTWIAWQLLRGRMPTAVDATPIFEKLPVHVVFPWMLAAIGGAAWLVARRKKREWLHATVMLSLVMLLFIGLWLPLACSHWNGSGWTAWEMVEHALARPAKMVAYIVVPPLVGATVFTYTALRWPHHWRRNTGVVVALVLLVLVIAIEARRDVTEIGAFVYINFMHVVACVALVSVLALLVLGIATWIMNARGRGVLRQRDVLHGTITTSEHGNVAHLELASWLRGPRATCDAFCVTTQYGEVPVPGGALVVAATPLSSTLLRGGESVPTLRTGDRVALAGYTSAHGEGPFRHTSAPIPGAGGVTVGRVVDEQYGMTHVGLDLWRPSVAYLVICVAVALPGLAALLSNRF